MLLEFTGDGGTREGPIFSGQSARGGQHAQSQDRGKASPRTPTPDAHSETLNGLADHQEHDQPDGQENKEENLGDSHGGAGDSRKTEEPGDQSDHEKDD